MLSKGLTFGIPQRCYARVAPRSGLAAKHCINNSAGVADSDYRGEVKIVLQNISSHAFQVRRGGHVAQQVLEQITVPRMQEVKLLSETERSNFGLGSTGRTKARPAAPSEEESALDKLFKLDPDTSWGMDGPGRDTVRGEQEGAEQPPEQEPVAEEHGRET